ncbi:MAG TPA: hypothetical protein VGD03_10835 [Frankiaceae bacterium]
MTVQHRRVGAQDDVVAYGPTIYPKPFEIALDGTGAGPIVLPCNDDPDVDRSGWT